MLTLLQRFNLQGSSTSSKPEPNRAAARQGRDAGCRPPGLGWAQSRPRRSRSRSAAEPRGEGRGVGRVRVPPCSPFPSAPASAVPRCRLQTRAMQCERQPGSDGRFFFSPFVGRFLLGFGPYLHHLPTIQLLYHYIYIYEKIPLYTYV